jgi:hypothetical protein
MSDGNPEPPFKDGDIWVSSSGAISHWCALHARWNNRGNCRECKDATIRAEEREKILWLFRDIRENDTAVNGAAAQWAIATIINSNNTRKGEVHDE